MTAKEDKDNRAGKGSPDETRNPEKKARDEEREKLQQKVRWPFAERKVPEPPH